MSDKLVNFSGASRKRKHRPSKDEVNLLRNQHLYHQTQVNVIVGSNGNFTRKELPARVYQPVYDNMEVDPRAVLDIGGFKLWAFDEKFVSYVCIDAKLLEPVFIIDRNKGLAVEQAELSRLVNECVQALAEKSLLQKFGIEVKIYREEDTELIFTRDDTRFEF